MAKALAQASGGFLKRIKGLFRKPDVWTESKLDRRHKSHRVVRRFNHKTKGAFGSPIQHPINNELRYAK